jgi:hypothetical protein
MNYSRKVSLGVLIGLTAVAIMGRLLPHPPNFTPVAAVALFAGYFLGAARPALLVALLVMFLSDAVIGFYDMRVMLVTYAALLLPALLGVRLHGRLNVLRLGTSSLVMSVVFFTASNMAWWAFSGMYEATTAGLGRCFSAGIPFFRYTLVGDLFWTATIFGLFALARTRVPAAKSSNPVIEPSTGL